MIQDYTGTWICHTQAWKYTHIYTKWYIIAAYSTHNQQYLRLSEKKTTIHFIKCSLCQWMTVTKKTYSQKKSVRSRLITKINNFSANLTSTNTRTKISRFKSLRNGPCELLVLRNSGQPEAVFVCKEVACALCSVTLNERSSTEIF